MTLPEHRKVGEANLAAMFRQVLPRTFSWLQFAKVITSDPQRHARFVEDMINIGLQRSIFRCIGSGQYEMI